METQTARSDGHRRPREGFSNKSHCASTDLKPVAKSAARRDDKNNFGPFFHMDQAQFETLVRRMETHASRAPTLYKLRVVGLALLGYAYLIGIVVGLLVLLAAGAVYLQHVAVLMGKLLILVIPILFVVLRSLWVRIDAPTGHRVTKHESPRLFEMLATLRK